MSDYIDILGYITGGPRVECNGLDVALAVMPPSVPRRPILSSLAAGSEYDQYPHRTQRDHEPACQGCRQTERSLPRSKRGNVVTGTSGGSRLSGAACGLSSGGLRPATTIKWGSPLLRRPLTESVKLRVPHSAEDPGSMTASHRKTVDHMRKLQFTARKRFGLRDEVDAPFKIIPPKPATSSDPKAGWRSLWNLG